MTIAPGEAETVPAAVTQAMASAVAARSVTTAGVTEMRVGAHPRLARCRTLAAVVRCGIPAAAQAPPTQSLTAA